ncbi:MAG: slipin family protein [Eggerthellaceae bacterium]|nr:slipin family protein [Eggerthellaceae bacterium]
MDKGSYFDEPAEAIPNSGGMDIEAKLTESTTSRAGAVWLRVGISSIPLLASIILAFALKAIFYPWAVLLVGLACSAVLLGCTHVVLEWERAVVLRFGKFYRVAGPGLIMMAPFIDSVTATVDMRIRSTAFKAEHVLTADLVPADVDAILFWTVWDAEKACTEVRSYERLIYWVAQTTLRDVMGAVTIAQLSTRREQIDKEVANILEAKTNEWGITITAVEIRDIEIPEDLQESLSAEARAERERNARMILAEVEKDISDLFVEAAKVYGDESAALQLRAMSMVSDSVKEKGDLVVIPSSLADAFEGLKKLGASR